MFQYLSTMTMELDLLAQKLASANETLPHMNNGASEISGKKSRRPEELTRKETVIERSAMVLFGKRVGHN